MTAAHDYTNGINPAGAYGRVELNDRYNRNLGFALLLSVALHLGGILLYVALTQITAMKVVSPPVRPEKVPPIRVIQETKTSVNIGSAPQAGGDAGGVRTIIGKLTALTDHLVDTTKKIADFYQMAIAVATPGDGSGGGPHGLGDKGLIGGGGGRLGDSIMIKHLDPAAIHKPDEIVEFAEINPKWDPADLRRRITYPPIALRTGIQGVVIVRVLIDRAGRVEDVVVEKCDNKILCDEAVKAVAKTPFTPGVQNGMPVKTWVQVDVHFAIDSE